MRHLFNATSGSKARLFRLLRILPSDDPEDVKVVLETHPLERAKCEALSYVWGDPADKRKIVCNRREVWITVNLYRAFKAQRRCSFKSVRRDERKFMPTDMPDESSLFNANRLLWADAVCINQSDIVEKTEQVRMIHYIYAKAEKVFISLDNAEEADKHAIAVAVYLFEQFGKKVDHDTLRDTAFKEFVCATKGIPDPGQSKLWLDIFTLLGHP